MLTKKRFRHLKVSFPIKKVFTSATQASSSPSYAPQSEPDLERRKKPLRLLAFPTRSISSLMKRAFRVTSGWSHTPVHLFWPVRHIFNTLQCHQGSPARFWLILIWWQRKMAWWITSLLAGSDLVRHIPERDPLEAKEASATCYTSLCSSTSVPQSTVSAMNKTTPISRYFV